MKVTVLGVTDKSFQGNDGPVAGVELEFDAGDGKRKALTSWIPPVVAEVLKWQAGDEHEIEEYTDKNGKAKFKTPQAGGKGGGFKGLSAAERMSLDTYQHERMDRRTALMQAVEWAKTYATNGAAVADVLGYANTFYEWLRENVPAPVSGGLGSAGGVVTSPPPPASSSGSGEAHTKQKAPVQGSVAAPLVGDSPSTPDPEPSAAGAATGEGSPPAAAHIHVFSSEAFEKDGRPINPRKGWEVCTGCLDARKAA